MMCIIIYSPNNKSMPIETIGEEVHTTSKPSGTALECTIALYMRSCKAQRGMGNGVAQEVTKGHTVKTRGGGAHLEAVRGCGVRTRCSVKVQNAV